MYPGTPLITFMQSQKQLKKQPIFQETLEQEITYIPINETQELIERLAYLTNSQAFIVPMKFWRDIRLSL